MRCGRCRRAYVGMSAKGNGGTYHYYACSGRQKLGRKGCDGERLPMDKLEAAILDQLTGLKALLRILIADLRVNSRAEILPTYRVGVPWFAHRQVQWS